MSMRVPLIIICLLALLAAIPTGLRAADEPVSCYTLNRQNGLSDDCVLQLLQLSDGRMIAVTPRAIDVYDGLHFTTLSIDTVQFVPVPAYNGATHLFSDADDCLWMKQWGRLYCFDLRTMSQLLAPGWSGDDDFFIDERGDTWLLKGRQLRSPATSLLLPAEAGMLQDVVAVGSDTYTFFDTGTLVAFSPQGQQLFLSTAYGPDVAERYKWTSLVAVGSDAHLYQVRTGPGGSVLLDFDCKSRQWRQLLTSERFMHTLTLTPSGKLYLTTADGYLYIDPATAQVETFSELRLPDGSVLSTGINTVCLDREGGIWLGTYGNGLLYTSPFAGLFDTRPINIEVHPILAAVYLHGQPLQVGTCYDGRCLLSTMPPYADNLRFSHHQNSLAFQFTTMNYVRPRSTCYRYRFSGDGQGWHMLTADSIGHLVDDKGVFYLPLVGLSPGNYTLEVMASTNPQQWNEADVRRISFTIEHPWWFSPVAFLLYMLLLAVAVVSAFWLYRRHLQRRNREAMLLLRIQNLVEQVNKYENAEAIVVLGPGTEASSEEAEPEPTPQEKEFMARATQLVEQHLSVPQYGVEQLAADLCMERTGLYKKLTALMQQSPVAFIRSIRLHRAASLIAQGNVSIAEVAERTGFSSASYFSKCFQKEFGCKPSEYDGRQHDE